MNANISANPAMMKRTANELNNEITTLVRQMMTIKTILQSLRRDTVAYEEIAAALRKCLEELEKRIRVLKMMREALVQIAALYFGTESSIASMYVNSSINIADSSAAIAASEMNLALWMGVMPLILPGIFPMLSWNIFGGTESFIDWIRNWFSGKKDDNIRYKVDSIVFDDEGSYGGDQGSPMSIANGAYREDMLRVIERNIGRQLNGTEREIYLRRLNSEGCGYVALVNTIFAAYANDPAGFKKTFGYPMYHNGDLNFDMLIADIYSSMDNTDGNGNYYDYRDYDNKEDGRRGNYSIWNDDSGSGTYPGEQVAYIESFMRDRGVNVNAELGVNVTVDNFAQITSEGKQVIVDFYNGDLLNMDGSIVQAIGGHSMTVTGVTQDGHFIVSSWGKEYMIDPNGTNADTSMIFVTVDYN